MSVNSLAVKHTFWEEVSISTDTWCWIYLEKRKSVPKILHDFIVWTYRVTRCKTRWVYMNNKVEFSSVVEDCHGFVGSRIRQEHILFNFIYFVVKQTRFLKKTWDRSNKQQWIALIRKIEVTSSLNWELKQAVLLGVVSLRKRHFLGVCWDVTKNNIWTQKSLLLNKTRCQRKRME